MKTIICLSGTNWRAVPGRTQQLITRMYDAQTLFFEPPVPSLTTIGSGKMRRRLTAYKQKGRKIRDGITVYALPPILPGGDKHRWIHRHNQKKLANFICAKMQSHGFFGPVIWAGSPIYADLIDYLTYSAIVFDCERRRSSLMPAWEKKLTSEADVVFAASHGIFDALSEHNKNTFLLPGGVNYTLFSKTEETELSFPPDLFNIRNPILGFSGTLWSDIDLSPVALAAAAHPEWSFVFVGRVKADAPIENLKKLSNVHFLDHKRPGSLPDYVVRFDVCMHLDRLQNQNSDVIPPRIYEYLSTGKPIVAMLRCGALDEFADVIYRADSDESFVAQCEQALLENSAWKTQRRREFGAGASWKGRVAEMNEILERTGVFI